jgi:hypothetical protein
MVQRDIVVGSVFVPTHPIDAAAAIFLARVSVIPSRQFACNYLQNNFIRDVGAAKRRSSS